LPDCSQRNGGRLPSIEARRQTQIAQRLGEQ
jgi:hypothetical protein